jgi:hypothetical protein
MSRELAAEQMERSDAERLIATKDAEIERLRGMLRQIWKLSMDDKVLDLIDAALAPPVQEKP